MTRNRLLGPWRRIFQWTLSLLILLIPWGRINNQSLLRVDIPHLSLQLFGTTLRIEELYLLLFFSLSFVLFFLLVTLISGRVWCGWTCPQTTLSDLTEWTARKLKLKVHNDHLHGAIWRKILFHIFLILLALLVGSNLLWYFIEPQLYFKQLLAGQLHSVALGTLVITGSVVYLDLAFLRRLFCREFCPYGRFQSVLVDKGTLILHRPESEAPRCIECGACVRACPMEIDIRKGYHIECINCGCCLDACRKVMTRLEQPGLIRYSFGTNGQGLRSLLNPRTLVLLAGFIGLLGLLIVSAQSRSDATLKVALSHQVASRQLTNGDQVSFFNAWIKNRTTGTRTYHLQAWQQSDHRPLTLKGPTDDITVQAGQNLEIDFVLLSSSSEQIKQIVFILLDQKEQKQAEATALITSSQSRKYDQK